ncbi:hypothetical protein [Dolosigranulum savutiense]|uniref:Uncharacterized protein n=1 Tax=Dolosigranulum savutiense TaxID=3110288 RepID=A0AB74TQZ1_9LACT
MLEQLLKVNNGILTKEQLTNQVVSYDELDGAEQNIDIKQFNDRLYYVDGYYDHDYLLQLSHPDLVFSRDTAVKYHWLSNQLPYELYVTLPTTYKKTVQSDYSKVNMMYEDLESADIELIETQEGNFVQVTSLERTLYDMMQDKSCPMDIMKEIIWNYHQAPNINKERFIHYFGQWYHLEDSKEAQKLLQQHVSYIDTSFKSWKQVTRLV